MTCPKCGAENDSGAVFCISCGEKTSLSTDETVSLGTAPDDETVALGAAPPDETAAPETASHDAETEVLDAVPQPEDALLVATRGALADDYEVERELGRGGMAVVFEGVETELRRRVAIKVLPPEMATEDTAERFKREARMAASLDHPNIIPVYRVGQAEGIQYMAMKFVDGRGLDEIVKEQGALPTPVVVKLLADSARALAFAHNNGVIHRDIKGANILIEKDGRVLVTDFGIARAVGDHTITATGMVMGTPSYMSPEQCGGLKLTHESDQYSLGVLAFQLLTGSLPFDAETFVGLVQHHYMTPPPDIKKVRDDVPAELLAVVYRALAKKPEERFPDTKQMVAALDVIPLSAEERAEADHTLKEVVTGARVSRVEIDDLPPLVTPMETALAGATGAKSRLPMIVAAAAAVVAMASVGIAWQAGMFGAGAEPVQQTEAQPVPHILTIPDLPAGVDCRVGEQPCREPLLAGQHTLVIAGSQEFERLEYEFQMPDADFSLSVAPLLRIREARPTAAGRPAAPVDSGSVLVRVTNTQSATILLDGSRIGNSTPITVPVGRHTVTVTANGFVRIDTSVVVAHNQQARLPLTLVPSNQP